MDSDNRIQDVDVNSSTEVGQTEQKENEIVEKDQDPSYDTSSFSPEQDLDQDHQEGDNLEKMILATGIRVGTPVKTKFMTPFIVRANPEGLYILDISKTLSRIDVAPKFISRADIARVAITSAREYGKTPVQKIL